MTARHAHCARRPEMKPSRNGVITCPACGKNCFTSRKDARTAGRQVNATGGRRARMRVYQCGPWWHLTSVPAARIVKLRRASR